MKKEKPLGPPPLKVGARRPTATDQEVQLFSSCLAFPLSDGLPSFACQPRQNGAALWRDAKHHLLFVCRAFALGPGRLNEAELL